MKPEKNFKQNFVSDIKQLIEEARKNVAVTVNSVVTVLYWQVGRRINSEILNDQRAEYGKQIVKKLASELTQSYGTGWSEKQLRQCMQFANTFQSEEIVYTLCRQLSWSHIRMIYDKRASFRKTA